MSKDNGIIARAGTDLDRDLEALHLGVQAMETSTPRMRKATLEYLWDRYVTHAENEKPQKPGD